MGRLQKTLGVSTALILLACGGELDDASATAPASASVQGEQDSVDECCGCLCADARWSCSVDTCTDAQGAVRALGPEAGFIEVEAGFIDPAAKGRMFYNFHPADVAPSQKPLLVLFNGGPFTSMLPLWGGNTAPYTVDPAVTGAALIVPNPTSWTRFANVLYVDSPFAGFSYVIEGAAAPGIGDVDLIGEAAAFTSMLMRFLAHHPQLEKSRLVLVGESYGGLRANHMLTQMLHYRSLRSDGTRYGRALAQEIEDHLIRALGSPPAGGFTPQQIGQHLGQVQIQGIPAPGGVFGRDPTEQTDELASDAVVRLLDMTERILQPAVFAQMTGVVIESIEWMSGAARAAEGLDIFAPIGFDLAPRSLIQTLKSEAAFREVFGPPPYGYPQVYLRPYVRVLMDFEVGNPRARFADALRWVPTFITNAALDATVSSDLLIAQLATLPGVRRVLRRRMSARLEQVGVTFSDGGSRTVQLPSYPNSGHAVTMFEPALIADDLQRWLALRNP